MSWAVGDLAVCVDGHCGEHFPNERSAGTVTGTVYRVTRVRVGPFHECRAAVALSVAGLDSGPLGICCERFRKVVKDKNEACESEFIDLLNRSKVPANA